MNLRQRYVVEAECFKKETDSKDSWSRLRVNVFEKRGKKKTFLGSYERNYSSLYNTFEPFEQNGKHYALISSDYTTTSVLSLPDCKIIATEGDWNCWGFCPTGFYVPAVGDKQIYFENDKAKETMQGKFGFVCGCVWGDDGSWKIQFLDLSEIDQGKVIRDDRFGYVELNGSSKNLKKAFEYMYIGEHGAIDINLKGIHHHPTYLKHKVGPNNIDANQVAEEQAKHIISRVEYFLKKKAENITQSPPEKLDETERKYIREILYNTIVTVTEEKTV